MEMLAGLISWKKLVVSFAWRALDSEELFLSNLDRNDHSTFSGELGEDDAENLQ